MKENLDRQTLHTPRLGLRPVAEPDRVRLFEIWSEPEVSRHLLTQPGDADHFRDMFDIMLQMSRELAMWSVIERSSRVLIGRCGFYAFGQARLPELAYLLSRSYWGRGLASEMARAAIRYAFETRRWERVVALVPLGNLRSRRVAEKIGMSALAHDALAEVPSGAEAFEIKREVWAASARGSRIDSRSLAEPLK